MSCKIFKKQSFLRACLATCSAIMLIFVLSPTAIASDKGSASTSGQKEDHGKKSGSENKYLDSRQPPIVRKLGKLDLANPAIAAAINSYKARIETATATFKISIKTASDVFKASIEPAETTRSSAIDAAKGIFKSAREAATTDAARQSAEQVFKAAVKAANDAFESTTAGAQSAFTTSTSDAKTRFSTDIATANAALRAVLSALLPPLPLVGANPKPSPSASPTST